MVGTLRYCRRKIRLRIMKYRWGAYIMYDSNNNKLANTNQSSVVRKEERNSLQKEDTNQLLDALATEYEEKLYSVKVRLNTRKNLLLEKEKEFDMIKSLSNSVKETNKTSDNKIKDDKKLSHTIEKIEKEIEELRKEQERLSTRITGLKGITEYLSSLDQKVNKKDVGKDTEIVLNTRNNYNDKGLSLLEAQEIERQRIARDLHDSTVQSLTSLVHKSELCNKLIDIDSVRAKLELVSMSNTIKSVINDMRGIIYNLKPMTLDDLGLTVTLDRYANRLMDFNNINVIVHSNEETKEILPVIKLTLFRIIQEACNNVIKHANATVINIDVNYEEHRVTVAIRDNGTGFDINASHGEGHTSSFGLSIMQERISLLSGKVELKSEKGKGTIVTISVPITIYEGEKDE